MSQAEQTNIESLRKNIRKLNSKAGQIKMDLHDLAEGLPTGYETLIQVAQTTYEIYEQLDLMNQQLKQMEQK